MRLEVLSDTALRQLEPARLMALITHVQRFIDKAVAYQRSLIAVAESERAARAVGDACVADSLVRNTGMSRGAARRASRQAKIIAAQPEVAGALACGDINTDQAEAIARADVGDGRHAPHTYPQSPNFSLHAEIERGSGHRPETDSRPNLPHAQTHRRNTIVNFANIPTPATKTCSDCGEKFRSVGADTCAECRYYEDNPHLAPGYFRWTRATGRWIATAVWKTDMPVPKPGDTITVHRKDGDTSKQTVTEELPDRIDATGDRIVSLAVKTSQ